MEQRWAHGDVVTRSEDLGLQPAPVTGPPAATGIWLEFPVHIVEDSAEQLVSYTAQGAPLNLPPGPWPSLDGLHPWQNRQVWSGHGCLMIQKPGEHYAIWHFWEGPERTFAYWYLNLQVDFVRTVSGYRTQDLELDIIVAPDGSHIVKDDEYMEDRIAEGRYTPDLVRWVRGYGDQLIGRLESEGPWWDTSWAGWTPPAGWDVTP